MVEEQRARADLPHRHGCSRGSRDATQTPAAAFELPGSAPAIADCAAIVVEPSERLARSAARRTSEERCACAIWSGACTTPDPSAIHRRSIGFAPDAPLGRSRAARRCEMLVGDVAQLAFRVLGPLEATVDGQPVRLTGRRERALLGVLLLNAGTVVSIEQLIDGVWGDPAPQSARHMVHEYVLRVRAALGDATLISTRAPGYAVAPAAGELDAGLLRRARPGGAPRARGDAQRRRAALVRPGARPLARRRAVRRRAGGQRARRRRFA